MSAEKCVMCAVMHGRL